MALWLALMACGPNQTEEAPVCLGVGTACEGDVGSCESCCPGDAESGDALVDGCWYACDDGWERAIDADGVEAANDLIGHCTPSLFTDPVSETGDTATPPTGLQTCPWVGTWEVTAVTCGAFGFDDWFDRYDTTTWTLSHSATGGCDVAFSWAAATCQESERWHFAEPAGTSVQVIYYGIEDCSPAECTIGPGDDGCVVGDRTGGAELTVDDRFGDLEVVGALGHGAPECALDLVTTWTRR